MIDPTALFKIATHPKAIYRVLVDDKDITTSLAGRLVSLSLTDNRGFEADQLDIQLDDTDGKLDLPPRGAELRIAFGWADQGLIDKGSYTVDEVEHSGAPDTLTIRARSADLRSGLTTQRERSWHDVTLGDIVETIADECDLEPLIQATLAGQYIEHIDQTNETAANLLTRLAKQFDAIATVKNDKLLFIPAAGGVSASGLKLPTVTIKRESGDQHRFSISDRETYAGVKATYNDVQGAVKGEVTWGKTEDATERHEPAPHAAPTSGQYKDAGETFKSRSAALKAARKQWNKLKGNTAQQAAYVGVKARYKDPNLDVFGEVTYGQAEEEKARRHAQKQAQTDAAKSPDAEPPISPGTDNVKTLRHVYASKANALRAARAEWRRLQRGMATFSITLAKGRPEFFPEIPATVSGFKPQIDGTEWILSKVTHNLTDNGLTTSLELEIKATEIPD